MSNNFEGLENSHERQSIYNIIDATIEQKLSLKHSSPKNELQTTLPNNVLAQRNPYKKKLITAFILLVMVGALVFFEVGLKFNEKSFLIAQKFNSQIEQLRNETLNQETVRTFNDIWNDEAISDFYSKLSGVVDAHYRTKENIDDYFQENIATFQELDLAFINIIITYRIKIIECIRNLIIKEESDLLATKMLSTFKKRSGEITSKGMGGSDFINDKLTNPILHLINQRTYMEDIGITSRDKYKHDIKKIHKKIFFNRIQALLSNEADRWNFSKYGFFYFQLGDKPELEPDFKTIDKFFLVAEKNLTKAKISESITSYNRNFLKTNVSASKIADYRDIFYGPFDIVRTYFKKSQGEKEFKEFAIEKFGKYVFTPADFEKLINGIVFKVENEIRGGVNEYLSYASEFRSAPDLDSKYKMQQRDYVNHINLPEDKRAEINSVLDMLDTGIFGAQILIMAGVIAAPETGGWSLPLSIVGIIWDACLVIKDFVLNPAYEVVEVVKIRNSIQIGLCERLLFNSKKDQKGILEASYEQVNTMFNKLGRE